MTTPSALPYARERALAEAAVLRAAILTKKVQSTVKAVSKDDKSPVTAADFAAQALLIAALRAAFPGDRFLGEEDSRELRKDPGLVTRVYELVSSVAPVDDPGTGAPLAIPASVEDTLALIDLGGQGQGGREGRFWVMDPVDGTKTFLRGQQYAVSLALIENGREVVGVLCCPNLRLADGRVDEDSVDPHGLGVMLTAVRGQGATVRTLSAPSATPYVLPPPERLARLSPPSDMKDLHIVDSRLSTAIRHDVIEQLAQQLGAKYPGTEVWSSHIRYTSLILRGADCQVRVPIQTGGNVYIWDHAGAQLIFTEVGGKITDLDGKEMDFGAGRQMAANRGMMVAREGVHGELLTLVNAIVAS